MMKQQTKGYLLMFFSLFMLLGFLASTRDYPLIVDLFTFCLFIALPFALGLSMIVKESANRKRAAEEQTKFLAGARQREVLRFLKEKNGSATVAEIAAETSLPADEAEKALNELIIRGLITMTMNSAGHVVYELVAPSVVKEAEARRDLDRLLEE
jgi:predicted transcriptional regulator